jgi:hypothetical protein
VLRIDCSAETEFNFQKIINGKEREAISHAPRAFAEASGSSRRCCRPSLRHEPGDVLDGHDAKRITR